MTLRTLLTLFGFLSIGGGIFMACDDDVDTPAPSKLEVEFANVVGNQALVLGKKYATASKDTFTVSKFNYFISNIKLSKANGEEWAEPESYHLVKQADPASQKFTLSGVPAGDYNSLTFTIGVDSARNVSGAQTGALDVLNDMFWNWNSGYIFLKLEGTSPQSRTGQLSYHIGGFYGPNNTIRTVTPSIPNNILQVRADRLPKLYLKADVLKMFAGRDTIRFAQVATTGHSADPNSVKLANNYAAGMFSIDRVQGHAQ